MANKLLAFNALAEHRPPLTATRGAAKKRKRRKIPRDCLLLSFEGDICFSAARRHPDELATKEHSRRRQGYGEPRRAQIESMQVIVYVLFTLFHGNRLHFVDASRWDA